MENIENKYNQALSSFIYQRCLIRDCSYIAIVDAIVMSTSLIIANAILFLASDESKMITGTEIVIDGGLSAQ